MYYADREPPQAPKPHPFAPKRRASGPYIQVYNTFIPNNIVIKTEKSLYFGKVQQLRFAQSIDIDGGKRTLYLYSYENHHIYFATDFTFLQY